MKKFVIVIISIVVLFSFLMLNYLVWDKENLQKQRESDRLEQDWLKGQNRILSTTVEELENSNSSLQKTTEEQRTRIRSMEEEIRALRQQQLKDHKRMSDQTSALDLYKSFFTEDLENFTEDWFSCISKNRYKESLSFLHSDFNYWDRQYDAQDYIDFISAIEYIGVSKEGQEENPSFVILEGGDPQIVAAQVTANVQLREDASYELTELSQGINYVEIGFSYNSMSKTWQIMYIDTKNIANP